MSRQQVMDLSCEMILYPTLYHVRHHRYNHSRENYNTYYIYYTGNKDGHAIDILVATETIERIAINQEIEGENPLTDMIINTILLPLTTRNGQ
jgi:hypothetical protein